MIPAGPVSAALVLVTATAVRAAGPPPRRRAVTRLRRSTGSGARVGRPRPVPRWLPAALDACALAWDAGQVWTAWLLGAGAVLAVGLVAGGPGAAAVAAACAVAGPVLAWRLLRHRGDARLEAELPAGVEAVARSLRSGGSLRQGLAEAAAGASGRLGADLLAVERSLAAGAAVVAALEGWAARRPLPGVRLAVAALCLGAETGGAQARAVDGVAATLRGRQAVQAEARALATQARASAAVIALAPVGFCALAATVDGRTASFLLRTPVGLAMLAGGLGLDALGALWMARLTRVVP